jgi:hypothetical protein
VWFQWAQQDSNLRLRPCEGRTLPLSYAPAVNGLSSSACACCEQASARFRRAGLNGITSQGAYEHVFRVGARARGRKTSTPTNTDTRTSKSGSNSSTLRTIGEREPKTAGFREAGRLPLRYRISQSCGSNRLAHAARPRTCAINCAGPASRFPSISPRLLAKRARPIGRIITPSREARLSSAEPSWTCSRC